MTKRVVIFLLAALAVPVSGWGDVFLSLEGPASPVTVGSSFWVNVNISGAVDLYAYQFDLTYPADMVQAIGAANGDFLPAADLLLNQPLFDTSTAGLIQQVSNTLTGDAPGVNGAGWLASVQFQALAPGVADIEPLNLFLLNSNLDLAPDVSGVGTDVTITSGSGVVPEPGYGVLLALGVAALVWRRLRTA